MPHWAGQNEGAHGMSGQLWGFGTEIFPVLIKQCRLMHFRMLLEEVNDVFSVELGRNAGFGVRFWSGYKKYIFNLV